MKNFLSVLCCAALSSAPAAITLPDILADHMVVQRNKEIPVWGTAAPNVEITAELSGKSATAKADADGKWSLKLPALPAGGPYDLKVSGDGEVTLHDVLVGDVWLSSGQSNLTFRMVPNLPFSEGALNYEQELAAANNPNLRFFEVVVNSADKPVPNVFGDWLTVTPTNMRYVSAISYFFGKGLQAGTGIPIGVIVSGRGATSIRSWLPHDVLEQFPDMKAKFSADEKLLAKSAEAIAAGKPKITEYVAKYKKATATDGKVPSFPNPFPNYATRPCFLYNAMIAPLAQMPITGFVWYQGESDSQIAKDYPPLFKALIQSRRAQWNLPEAPFLFVQLANYDPVKGHNLDGEKADKINGAWAAQRLSQATALDLPRTAMATAADAGDEMKIHPRDKKKVSDRLVLAALALEYGKDIPYRGPRVKSTKVDGGKVTLDFDAEGSSLKSVDSAKDLNGFELAGSDGVFHAATAVLEGTAVTLSAPEVSAPTQVRYAFADNPKLCLYETNGLPCAPFVKTLGEH